MMIHVFWFLIDACSFLVVVDFVFHFKCVLDLVSNIGVFNCEMLI